MKLINMSSFDSIDLLINLVKFPNNVFRKPTFSDWGHGMEACTCCSGTLTENRHLVWISTENSDVFLHPLQGESLVVQSGVASVGIVLGIDET